MKRWLPACCRGFLPAPGRRLPLALPVLLAAAALIAAPVLSPQAAQAAQAAQVQHEGVTLDTAARVGGETLQLNGMGLRGVAWIRAFVAGLYVAQPSRDPQRLLDQPGAKRLTLKILLDAPAAELGKAVRRGVPRNVPPDALPALADRVERLAARIDEIGRVHPGDTLDLDYDPARGVVARVNGEPRGAAIPGEDLYRAVLGIFIGERPVDPRLKQGLLSGAAQGSVDRPPAADGAPARAGAAAVPSPLRASASAPPAEQRAEELRAAP